MRRRSRGMLVVVIAAVLAVPAVARAQSARNGPCKPVFDAMLKATSTPHHAVTTDNGATVGESILVADAMYVKVKGDWHKSPLTPAAYLAQQQENLQNVTVASCKSLPDEAIDGKVTAVYQAHYEQKDLGASDARIWIVKATGLPIRTDSSLAGGEKTSASTRYDYDHITAPVVK
jgi:hypothetical protein